MAEAAPQARPKATGDDGIVSYCSEYHLKDLSHLIAQNNLHLMESSGPCSHNILSSNALPIPMLRQVFLDLSEVMFYVVFLRFFTKITENEVSGSTFPHVLIAIFT